MNSRNIPRYAGAMTPAEKTRRDLNVIFSHIALFTAALLFIILFAMFL